MSSGYVSDRLQTIVGAARPLPTIIIIILTASDHPDIGHNNRNFLMMIMKIMIILTAGR